MNDKPGYKHTPLGWIPKEWEISRLDKLGAFKNGINKEKEDFGHGHSLVGLMDIFGISRVYNNKQYSLVNSTIKERKDYSLKAGDVLFVRSSVKPEGVGLTSLICEDIPDAVFSGFIIRFRSNGELENEYKAHCFFEEGFRKRLLNKSTISANTNINQVALSSLIIPIPKKIEQRRIAAILSTWDEAITKTQQLIAQLQQRNKGLMQQLLTGKKRLKAFEKTKWKLKLLSDCLNYTPREVPKPSSNFLALGIRSHGKGIFHKNDFDPAVIAMEALYEVKENDLIVNITFAWEQAIAIAGKEDEGGLVSHRFPTYTFKTKSAIPAYFKFLIIQKNFKYMLDLISPGGAGRNRVMSKNNFLKLEIEIPDVNEQKMIADILNSALNEVKLNQEKLLILQQQKKGLMQKLLTGEVRVKLNNQEV